MDGSTKKKDRKKALSAEPDDENPIPDVLVVQIQTACEGLNLQHFSEIYFSTPHWNPAVEDQAVARAHFVCTLRGAFCAAPRRRGRSLRESVSTESSY